MVNDKTEMGPVFLSSGVSLVSFCERDKGRALHFNVLPVLRQAQDDSKTIFVSIPYA